MDKMSMNQPLVHIIGLFMENLFSVNNDVKDSMKDKN